MRRSGRIPKQLPILLIGSDLDGRVFSEPTTTVLLSLHGAGIVSHYKLSPEQELVLRWPEKNKEAEIRVVGRLGSQNGKHTYGVAFFDTDPHFWDIDFPPITAAERELGLLSIVCSSCNALEKVDDAGIEADVCATNDGVLRFCKRCGAATLWKSASSSTNQPSLSQQGAQLQLFSAPITPPPASLSLPSPAPTANPYSASVPLPITPPVPPASPSSYYAQSPESALDSSSNFLASRPDSPRDSVAAGSGNAGTGSVAEPLASVLTTFPPAPQPSSATPRANRRKHPRVKVDYSACVRLPGRADDVVQCEDMSKGGLRFKSGHQYFPLSLIEVAVPYQPGQPAIFVPAQIVFVERLPEQSLFRCGVQYLIRSTKPRDSF